MFARKKQQSIEGNHQDTRNLQNLETSGNVFKGFKQTHDDFHNKITQLKTQETQEKELENHANQKSPMSGAELLQMFSKKKCQVQKVNVENLPGDFDPRSLFNNSPKRVPQNSDAESED